MDASLQSRVEVLAREIAGQARTIEDVNGLMRLMMKSALERMLDTEMDVHLGRRPLAEPSGRVGGDRNDSDRVARRSRQSGPRRRRTVATADRRRRSAATLAT